MGIYPARGREDWVSWGGMQYEDMAWGKGGWVRNEGRELLMANTGAYQPQCHWEKLLFVQLQTQKKSLIPFFQGRIFSNSIFFFRPHNKLFPLLFQDCCTTTTSSFPFHPPPIPSPPAFPQRGGKETEKERNCGKERVVARAGGMLIGGGAKMHCCPLPSHDFPPLLLLRPKGDFVWCQKGRRKNPKKGV